MVTTAFWILLVLDLALSAYSVLCVRREYRSEERLSVTTAYVVWFAYVLHLTLSVYAAWSSMWPLPLNRSSSVVAGMVVSVAGIVMLFTAMHSFRSARRISGLEKDMLITGGIYRYSRNPQNVGWGLVLLGIALVGRSGIGIVLTAVFWLIFRLYLPVEEQYLRRVFGSEYERYHNDTPRYLGPSRRTPNRDASNGEAQLQNGK